MGQRSLNCQACKAKQISRAGFSISPNISLTQLTDLSQILKNPKLKQTNK